MSSKINSSLSFISELPNNINLLHFKKNTKAAKLILLTELIYIIISQSRNYNSLYISLTLQIEIIKKKLFENINDKLLIKNGANLIHIFKLKLKKDNINYENFIKNLIFSDKNLSFLINTIVKRANFEIDSSFLNVLTSLQEELSKNNLLTKFKYLKKIQLYIKQFTFSKFREINSFFYPIIFSVLKKETHRLKLKILMRRIITKYIFKGLNIELSKEKLQSSLLKAFKISTKFNIRLIPYIEEIHLKERKPLKKKKDIVSSSDLLVNNVIKNFNLSYYKLFSMLKKNNLHSIPLVDVIKFISELESKTFYNFLKNIGLSYNLIKNDFIINNKNEKISIFNILKTKELFLLDKNNLFKKKHFFNIYSFYNLYNSISKRKKINFFLSILEKKIEYFSLSPIKYYYYDQLSLQIEKNEIDSADLKNYIIIKKILFYLKKYKNLFFSIKNVRKYFKNFEKNEKNKNLFKTTRLKNINIKVLIYFFQNLQKLYSSKLLKDNNKSLFLTSGKDMFFKKKLNVLFKDLLYVKGILAYLSTLKKLSLKFLNKKKDELKHKYFDNLNNYVNSYFYILNDKYLYSNFKVNHLESKDIKKTISLFNFSEELNKYYIYSQYNKMYKNYFSYLRTVIKKIKNINKVDFLTTLNYNKHSSFTKFKNKIIIDLFKSKIIYNIPSSNSKFTNNKKDKFTNKLLSIKIFNVNMGNTKMDEINDYLLKKNININSYFSNLTLKNNLYLTSKFTNKYNQNKDIITTENLDIMLPYAFKTKLNQTYKNNIIFINNSNNYNLKELNIQENLNNFFYKKLLFYKNIILLSKFNNNYIEKNNCFFLLNNKSNKELFNSNLIKIKNLFTQEDYNKLISKTIDYTTTELKKITKYQMKKKKLKKIY